jgi:hypothetical protein
MKAYKFRTVSNFDFVVDIIINKRWAGGLSRSGM